MGLVGLSVASYFMFPDQTWQSRAGFALLVLLGMLGLVCFVIFIEGYMIKLNPARTVLRSMDCALQGQHREALRLLREAAAASAQAREVLALLEEDLANGKVPSAGKLQDAWHKMSASVVPGQKSFFRFVHWLAWVALGIVTLRVVVSILEFMIRG